LEHVAWGGRRYDEPTLKVDMPDGSRVVEWALAGHRVERGEGFATLIVELGDRTYPLRAELYYRVFDGCDVVERWARVAHGQGKGPLVVCQVHAANWWMPERSDWGLTFLQGGWGCETQVARTALGPHKVVLESRRGTTSHQLQPFFALGPQPTDEVHGELWSGQIAWSGSWKLVCEVTAGGHVHVSGGWNDWDTPLELGPGEDLVTPVFAGLASTGGFGAMSRAWHDYELCHVLGGRRPLVSGLRLPSLTGRRGPGAAATKPAAGAWRQSHPVLGGVPGLAALRPVLYNSWEATAFSVTEQGQSRLAELAAEMGTEVFVVDDGWFVGRSSDRAGLGDWRVDPAKFPGGLEALVDKVHQLGMSFGLWVEPEMANPDSDLYRAHPDWVWHFAERERSEKRNQLVLNLARDDVAQWVYETIDALLGRYGIDFVKWDMNRHLSEPGWPDEVGNNPERAWVEHTANLYAVLDRLRQAHPGVDFESCSGGGGRVDLGIMSRIEQVWTSDNTDAWDRIAIQEGFSMAHAPLAMMAWVTDSPNPLTGRRLPLSYRFHVAMAGSLGIGGDLAEWSPAERDEARELVSAYKAVRPVVQHGHLYRLATTRTGPLGAFEYVSRDGSEVVVLAWSGLRRFGTYPRRLRLAGLSRDARYRDQVTGEEHLGSVLCELGLCLPDGQDFTSMLAHLRQSG